MFSLTMSIRRNRIIFSDKGHYLVRIKKNKKLQMNSLFGVLLPTIFSRITILNYTTEHAQQNVDFFIFKFKVCCRLIFNGS